MSDSPLGRPEFLAKMVEQLQRIDTAAREARKTRQPLAPIECAFCGHIHANYGYERGHVRYVCPQCGQVIVQ